MAASRPVPVTAHTVRLAQPSDGSTLFGSWQRLRQHNAAVDRRYLPAPVSEAEFVADLQQLLGRPQSATFVAEASGSLAGFLSGTIERNLPDRLPEEHATVGYLWVEQRFRRQGIARALFAAFSAWASTHGDVAHFEMAVLMGDKDAAQFWRSIGFTPFIERLWAPLSAPESED